MLTQTLDEMCGYLTPLHLSGEFLSSPDVLNSLAEFGNLRIMPHTQSHTNTYNDTHKRYSFDGHVNEITLPLVEPQHGPV